MTVKEYPHKGVNASPWQSKTDSLQIKPYLPSGLLGLAAELGPVLEQAVERVRFGDEHGYTLPRYVWSKIATKVEHSFGMPLLHPADFPVDKHLAAELAPIALSALALHTPELIPLATYLQNMLRQYPGLLQEACFAVQCEQTSLLMAENNRSLEDSCLHQWEQKHPEAPHLLRFAAQYALKPSLEAAARKLGTLYEEPDIWRHGHCPVCGCLPLMGRLTGPEGSRFHTCSFCSFEYPVPKSDCPFCLTFLGDSAEYLNSPTEPGYLLALCPECHYYLKLVDTRISDGPWLPMLDDLASLPLDFHARQRHYRRPTLSAWGF